MTNLSIKIWLAVWAAIFAAVYFTSNRNYKTTENKKVSKKELLKEGKKLNVIHPCTKKVEDDYKLLLTELKLAENFMSADDQEEAICHFTNAIVMSSDPFMFVNSLSQTLPQPTFKKLMSVLNDTYAGGPKM